MGTAGGDIFLNTGIHSYSLLRIPPISSPWLILSYPSPVLRRIRRSYPQFPYVPGEKEEIIPFFDFLSPPGRKKLGDSFTFLLPPGHIHFVSLLQFYLRATMPRLLDLSNLDTLDDQTRERVISHRWELSTIDLAYFFPREEGEMDPLMEFKNLLSDTRPGLETGDVPMRTPFDRLFVSFLKQLKRKIHSGLHGTWEGIFFGGGGGVLTLSVTAVFVLMRGA